MNDPAPPRRRWFSYGLRTFFVVLTIFCVWLGVQVKWIGDRHGALQSKNLMPYPGEAPLSLRIFGERGFSAIGIDGTADAHADESQYEKLQILFPEADVAIITEDGKTSRPNPRRPAPH